MRIIPMLVVVLTTTSAVQATEIITEHEARVTAAWWVQGTVFNDFVYPPNDTRGADAVWDAYRKSPNPAFAKMNTSKTKELLTHIDESVLAVRGGTGYCGEIKELTWIINGDKEFTDLNGGAPVMINARTGKVIDCRS